MALDDREAVLYLLREMQQTGSQAHNAASEDGGLTGNVRDILFGINTTLDAVVSLIEGEVIVHRCPPEGSGIMPCCGRTPFETPNDRMTWDPALVTCKGET